MTTSSRAVHLTARPSGRPTPDDFEIVASELADPGPGEVLVRNTMMSVDPYMRGRMNDTRSYVPAYELGRPMDGGAVGEVVASGADGFAPGDVVLHQFGWREHALVPATALRTLDTSRVPASAYLGVLGMPGLTAYAGLVRVAGLREGDTVFVSGAAGAVGSQVGQLAKLLGAGTVIGSAGSPEKVAWLEELGFDVALDYKASPIGRQLAGHGPVDVYFDNVGGDHLEAAISAMADHGRIAACGAIAGYNADGPLPGPRNLMMMISKRLTMRGFIVTDHADLAGEFYRQAGSWLTEGRLAHRETVVDGLDHAVEAFLAMMDGQNTGKMLVSLG
ncbi:MAG: NADP-dependent oxidoreductase [Nocardioides sp.]|nr:NADP-dependent oxidoreductase [Nocardioides sp.]